MQVNFENSKNISYNAAGREVVEEKNTTNSAFANDLNEAQKSNEDKEEKEEELTQKEKQEIADKLLKDIMSLFKTGLTVEELEMVQELLNEIRSAITEAKPPLSSDENKHLDSMITKLELMIMELQKKAKGEVVIDMEDSHVNNISKESKQNDKQGISSEIAEFQKRIDKVQNSLDELKKTINNSDMDRVNKNHEELELLQALMQ